VPAEAPEPAPAQVEPTAVPAPVPEPVPAPAVAPSPSPAPATPEPDPEAERQAAIDALTRDLVGTWSGLAQGRPFQLRVLQALPERITAELVFNPGPAQRVSPVAGPFRDGRLQLSGGDLTVEATLSSGRLSGSYQRGKRAIPFDLQR
jgi:hypothetical protein